jgi:hypothetical protein
MNIQGKNTFNPELSQIPVGIPWVRRKFFDRIESKALEKNSEYLHG